AAILSDFENTPSDRPTKGVRIPSHRRGVIAIVFLLVVACCRDSAARAAREQGTLPCLQELEDVGRLLAPLKGRTMALLFLAYGARFKRASAQAYDGTHELAGSDRVAHLAS